MPSFGRGISYEREGRCYANQTGDRERREKKMAETVTARAEKCAECQERVM